MKQINIIIAERDRDDCLSVCLHHLDIANSGKLYNVIVYVVSDRRSTLVHCENIYVFMYYFPTLTKYFNKAALLNYGLEVMVPDFDWLSIVDVDMMYNPKFFNTIDMNISDRSYLVSTGTQLSNGDVYPGASQISISRTVYELFQNIYGEKLYCEDFEGWGGEDSDLSLKSIDMKKEDLIDRRVISDMWIHRNHEKRHENEDYTRQLFEKRRITNKEILRRWLEK